jgi:hypothetical protein
MTALEFIDILRPFHEADHITVGAAHAIEHPKGPEADPLPHMSTLVKDRDVTVYVTGCTRCEWLAIAGVG